MVYDRYSGGGTFGTPVAPGTTARTTGNDIAGSFSQMMQMYGGATAAASPTVRRYQGPQSGPGGMLRVYKSVPVDQYQAEFWNRWEDPKFRTWLNTRLIASGRVSSRTPSVQDSYSAWLKLGVDAASAPGWTGTPEQLLEFLANGGSLRHDTQLAEDMASGRPAIDPATGMAIDPTGQGAPRTVVRTDRQVISLADAEAAADAALRAALGREATDSEAKLFRKRLQAALSSNPTKTTQKYDAEGNLVSTTSAGGLSSAALTDIADEVTEGGQFTPERRRYTAAGYMNALIGEVGAVF